MTTLADFGGVLQTGFALNLGLSVFESVTNIFFLRYERRIEGMAKCDFLVKDNSDKYSVFSARLASARTRLQQAEEAISTNSLWSIPVLLLASALCAVLLVEGAWDPQDTIPASVGWFCTAISFGPGVCALGFNIYVWIQNSEGVEESIKDLFASINQN